MTSAPAFAIGIELTPDAVVVALAEAGGAIVGPVRSIPPVVLVDGDQFVHGSEALRLGPGRPEALAGDLVGQFTVDRIFLIGGKMLTPDELMAVILRAVRAAATAERGQSPTAATISCPAPWDAAVRDRIARLAAAADLTDAHVTNGLTAATAALDAWTRLPDVMQPVAFGEVALPRLQSERTGPLAPQPSAVAPVVQRTELRSRRRATVASILAIVGIGAAVAIAVLVSDDDGPSTAGPTTPVGTTIVPTIPATTVGQPTRAMIGVTGAALDPAIDSAFSSAIGRGGATGFDLLLTPIGATAADLVSATASGSALRLAAVISTLPAAELDVVLSSAGDLPVICSVGVSPSKVVDSTVLLGTAGECVEVLTLAVAAAGDSDAEAVSLAATELIEASDHIACDTFEQCRNLIDGNQQVHYAPPGSTLRSVEPS